MTVTAETCTAWWARYSALGPGIEQERSGSRVYHGSRMTPSRIDISSSEEPEKALLYASSTPSPRSAAAWRRKPSQRASVITALRFTSSLLSLLAGYAPARTPQAFGSPCGRLESVPMRALLYAAIRSFRRNRMARFRRAFPLTPQTRVLDVGGTSLNWTLLTVRPRITLLNLPSAGEATVVGDGRHLPFRDRSFDIVFSNSVIEHISSPEDRAVSPTKSAVPDAPIGSRPPTAISPSSRTWSRRSCTGCLSPRGSPWPGASPSGR